MFKFSNIFKSILLIVALVGLFSAGLFFVIKKNTPVEATAISSKETVIEKIEHILQIPNVKKKPIPEPVSISRLKNQGCVADGLLSEYNPDSEKFMALVNRSNCYYLHRAIETWLKPPDFDTASYVMSRITKKDVVYGMFIAEALDTRADYYDGYPSNTFDFEKMCRKGSDNAWGDHSCKPTFASKEYRDYLEYITKRAMDIGVQSFTFGQIYMQESNSKNYAPKILANMRRYAKEKGINIVIGAQTGSITDPEYLKLFDYIEGGVGLSSDGSVENGPCLSTRGSCWALLWHKDFADKANNVLLHLDWSGIPSDDLDIFARMTKEKRSQTLQHLYTKFNSEKTGFMMPLMGVLYNDNNGCRGPKKKFYSPDNSYSCKDENAINAILSGKKINAQISQSAAGSVTR